MNFKHLIAVSLFLAGQATSGLAQEAPEDQKAFVAAIAASREVYDEATNDLLKSSERKTRAKALCDIVGKSVEGWVGEIYDLTTNGDGNGVLRLELEGDVWVGTFNNAFSDTGSDTLIPMDSELFKVLTTMANGQKVIFSGKFFKDDGNADCLQEKSLTEMGAMTEPEFLIRFSEVAAAE